MEQFYVLDDIDASDYRSHAGGQWMNDTRERCLSCSVFSEASEPREIEIALNHLGRCGFTEHLWNSHSLPIFRQDLIELWRSRGLTGFGVKPVRIVGWYNKPRKPLPEDIPTYYRLTTTSKARLSTPAPLGGPCPNCDFVKYAFAEVGTHLPNGLAVDPTSWDGADFFGLAQYEFVFCTWRAAEITLEARYNRHIAFVRVEDYGRWEEVDVRKWTPRAYHEHIESFLIRRAQDL